MDSELKRIKKKYGEQMMHLSRKLFPSILEKEGLLYKILSEKFNCSKSLYHDIVENNLEASFKDYIYAQLDIKSDKIESKKSPFELMKDAGYNLFECKNQSDIMNFSKYYSPDELLCTFKDRRLDTCFVFFAVKDNAEDILRSNFKNPKRQDDYGTSVISIQFTKGNINTLSIKNRYNHSVVNPDATFSNNLENIIPGLTYSFQKNYQLNINQNDDGTFELPNYVLASDGKWYRYNYEINNVYYCEGNIIIDNSNVNKQYIDKSRYLLIDYFIIDLVNKKVILYDNSVADSFPNRFYNINKIEIKKEDNGFKKIIINNNNDQIIIEIDDNNRIKRYVDNNLIDVEDNFFSHNCFVNEISMDKVKKIGDNFFKNNVELEEINFQNLNEIGNDFISKNIIIDSINLPNVRIIGNNFLCENKYLTKLSLKKIILIGDYFLFKNENMKTFEAPDLIKIGNGFLNFNYDLNRIIIPNVLTIGDSFLESNEKLLSLSIPCVEEIGNNFLIKNIWLNRFLAPKIRKIGHSFLYRNQALKYLVTNYLKEVGDNFMCSNRQMDCFIGYCIEQIGDNFLYYNNAIKNIDFPYLKKCGKNFMLYNEKCREKMSNTNKMLCYNLRG